MPLSGRQGSRNTGIAGNHIAQRRARELYRLLTWNNRLDFVLRVIPRHAGFPAQAIVEDQVGGGAPAVLRK